MEPENQFEQDQPDGSLGIPSQELTQETNQMSNQDRYDILRAKLKTKIIFTILAFLPALFLLLWLGPNLTNPTSDASVVVWLFSPIIGISVVAFVILLLFTIHNHRQCVKVKLELARGITQIPGEELSKATEATQGNPDTVLVFTIMTGVLLLFTLGYAIPGLNSPGWGSLAPTFILMCTVPFLAIIFIILLSVTVGSYRKKSKIKKRQSKS